VLVVILADVLRVFLLFFMFLVLFVVFVMFLMLTLLLMLLFSKHTVATNQSTTPLSLLDLAIFLMDNQKKHQS
jgi:hypothetical protein